MFTLVQSMSAILMGSFDSGTSAAAGRAAPIATAVPNAKTASDFAAAEYPLMPSPPFPAVCLMRAARAKPCRFSLATIIRGRPVGVKRVGLAMVWHWARVLADSAHLHDSKTQIAQTAREETL